MSDKGVKIIDHGWNKYKKQMKALNGSSIRFGFFGGSNTGFAKIAYTHEMGGVRQTTQKQRWYLRSKGMDAGNEIIIPERSYIRSSFDENKERILGWMEDAFKRIGDGGDKKSVLKSLAKKCKGVIVEKLESGDFVENDPFTREQKGYGKKPLEDKGALKEAIDFVVDAE